MKPFITLSLIILTMTSCADTYHPQNSMLPTQILESNSHINHQFKHTKKVGPLDQAVIFITDPNTILIMNNQFLDTPINNKIYPVCTHSDNHFYVSRKDKDCWIGDAHNILMKKDKKKTHYVVMINTFERQRNKCWLDSEKVNCLYGKAKFWLREQIDP